jgi:hypothetical protein
VDYHAQQSNGQHSNLYHRPAKAGLVLILFIVTISIITIGSNVLMNYSSIAFAFHTNSTGGPGTVTNLEGFEVALAAQDHLNAAGQAIRLGDDSVAMTQIQEAYRILSQFTGIDPQNTTSAGNAPSIGNNPEAGMIGDGEIIAMGPPSATFGANQTGPSGGPSGGPSSVPSDNIQQPQTATQEICGDRFDNDGDGLVDQNCP